MDYFVIVSYETDAERKRIDYLLDKWSERAVIKKPRGLVFVIDTEKPQEFFEELFSKLEGEPKEKVEIYEVKGVVKEIKKRSKTLNYTIPEEKRVVERFLEYLLSKLNAGLSYSDALAKVYEVPTRKGRGIVKVIIRGGKETEITIDIEGYGDVVEFLAEKIGDELKLFTGD